MFEMLKRLVSGSEKELPLDEVMWSPSGWSMAVETPARPEPLKQLRAPREQPLVLALR